MNEFDLLNERILVTKHRRTPSQMALLRKSYLKKCGCHVADHQTTPNDTHYIVHVTPAGKVRVSEIYCSTEGGRNRTRIKDRPGNMEEKTKYGIKR